MADRYQVEVGIAHQEDGLWPRMAAMDGSEPHAAMPANPSVLLGVRNRQTLVAVWPRAGYNR